MPLHQSHLKQIPVLETSLTVYYRTVWIPTLDPPDPLWVQPNSGRWATDWTLYTAQSEPVAWAEYCRNHPDDVAAADLTGGVGIDVHSIGILGPEPVSDPLPARALYRLEISFERLADLTSEWATTCLSRSGFELGQFTKDRADGYGLCPELAANALEIGWEGMIVPSAAWREEPGFCVPVFEAGRKRINSITELESAARPNVATAIGTTYQAGERPAWLS